MIDKGLDAIKVAGANDTHVRDQHWPPRAKVLEPVRQLHDRTGAGREGWNANNGAHG